MKKLLLIVATIGIVFVSGCTKEQQDIINTNNEIIKQQQTVENNQAQKPYKPFEDFYTPAFQLIWNDFTDKFVKHKIEFVDGNPPFADNLNQRRLSENMLSEKDYYKTIAPQTVETKKKIEKTIKEKFNEKSKILDSVGWLKKDDGFTKILYCMFKKNIYFEQEFENLFANRFNYSEKCYKYFGIKKYDAKLAKSVTPVYYNNFNDYAVILNTKSGDEIILQRIDDDKPVFDYWDKLYNEYLKNGTKIAFTSEDKLAVPEIKYSQMLQYNELSGHEIKNSKYVISKAIEAIDFKLNAKGAELRNEALMSVYKTAIYRKTNSRCYNFDKPFILFIRSKNAEVPYFALKIKDERYLVEKKQ